MQTEIPDSENDANISLKILDERIVFDDFESFANFTKLDNESRINHIDGLIESSTETFEKRSPSSLVQNEEDFVIYSDLIRSIINDDYMYQIGETVFKESYDYQFITHKDNIDLLYDEELLNARINAIGKAKNTDPTDIYSTATWSNTDLVIFPIQRSMSQGPVDEICHDALDDCHEDEDAGGVTGPPNGGNPLPTTVTNVLNSNTTLNEFFIQYHDQGTYRATFKALTVYRVLSISFIGYVKHEKKIRVLGIPVGWSMEDADFITIGGGIISATFENRFNTDAKETKFGSFSGRSSANVRELNSGSADILYNSNQRLYSVNSGFSDQSVNQAASNINYVIGRRVVFNK
jgi:hypothetical protein